MHNKSIVAKRLSVEIESTNILRQLSFSVEQGVLTGLVGPSGSGKTTLMRVLVGLQAPTTGQATVEGLEAGHPELRKTVGYVTQFPSVYEDLTVRQNIEYFGELLGVTHREVARAMHHVDLTPQRHQLVSTLSGGQKARVSLAVALLGDPDVLVMDEPTVGLDPVLRQRLWKLFRQLASQGKTLIISSHVMDEADRCDNLLLLREGGLLWSGTRKDLLKKAHARTVEGAFLSLVEGK